MRRRVVFTPPPDPVVVKIPLAMIENPDPKVVLSAAEHRELCRLRGIMFHAEQGTPFDSRCNHAFRLSEPSSAATADWERRHRAWLRELFRNEPTVLLGKPEPEPVPTTVNSVRNQRVSRLQTSAKPNTKTARSEASSDEGPVVLKSEQPRCSRTEVSLVGNECKAQTDAPAEPPKTTNWFYPAGEAGSGRGGSANPLMWNAEEFEEDQ